MQLPDNAVKCGRHILTPTDFVILLCGLPKHHEGPALGTVMPETAQREADRWCVYVTSSGFTERGS